MPDVSSLVAICTRSEMEDFLREAACMKEFDHPNVMRLLGEMSAALHVKWQLIENMIIHVSDSSCNTGFLFPAIELKQFKLHSSWNWETDIKKLALRKKQQSVFLKAPTKFIRLLWRSKNELVEANEWNSSIHCVLMCVRVCNTKPWCFCRCVSADCGERRLPLPCGYLALYETWRPAQLSAVLKAGRLSCGRSDYKQ